MIKQSLFAASLFLTAASSSHAENGGCPVRPTDPLVSIELFDGPVSDNVILAPDQSTGTPAKGKSVWNVSSIYAEGRSLAVACRYKSSPKPVMVEFKQKVATCTQIMDNKAGGSFHCR